MAFIWYLGLFKETIDISPTASVFVSDLSSPSEVIASNVSQNRLEDSQSQGKAIIGEMPSAAFGGDDIHHPLPPCHATDTIDDLFSGLPPSFTELLKNCSKELGEAYKI
ncbi:hypothetical protein HPP92_008176 [Vanilla planifolia]|uniref:Uncharacterized protein n=1 Tax=Vanilla planifolia TaxID=51239 RepID=A0A835V4D4_VANPL|nr:hypothetical protein HPP92_008332 [Vanilla planifolia]KAG0486081.1 hypothetical protein HPP92_008176 [Vanilla planifolia]